MDVSKGEIIHIYYGHGSWVNSVNFHQDGNSMITASADGVCKVIFLHFLQFIVMLFTIFTVFTRKLIRFNAAEQFVMTQITIRYHLACIVSCF